MSKSWKVTVLKEFGDLLSGMYVEIIKPMSYGANEPNQNEIRDMLSNKYALKAPSAVYNNRSIFKIEKN